FPSSQVKDPIAKQLLKLDQSPVSVWPENFVPPQVDQNADLAGGEEITSGSASPSAVVKLWQSELSKWKSQHPDEYGAYKKWVSGHCRQRHTESRAGGVAAGVSSGRISTSFRQSAPWRSHSATRSCRSYATASTRATSPLRRSGSASTTTRASCPIPSSGRR